VHDPGEAREGLVAVEGLVVDQGLAGEHDAGQPDRYEVRNQRWFSAPAAR